MRNLKPFESLVAKVNVNIETIPHTTIHSTFLRHESLFTEDFLKSIGGKEEFYGDAYHLKPKTAELGSVIEPIVTNLKSTLGVLDGIKVEVESASAVYQNTLNSIVAMDPILSKEIKTEDVPKIDVLVWTDKSPMVMEDITRFVMSHTNLSEVTTSSQLENLSRQYSAANFKEKMPEVSEETITALNLPTAREMEVFTFDTAHMYKTFRNKPFDEIALTATLAYRLAEVELNMCNVEISDDESVKAQAYIGRLKRLDDLRTFTASVFRNVMFKTALILPGKVLNNDLVEDKYSDKVVSQYLAHFNITQVPAAGIDAAILDQSIASIAAEAEKVAAADKSTYAIQRDRASLNSFITAMKSVVGTPTYSSKFTPTSASRIMTKHHTASNGDIQTAMYNTLIEMGYAGTAVEDLYKKVSTELTSLVAKGETLTKEQVGEAKVRVYARMVRDFVADKFLVVTKK